MSISVDTLSDLGLTRNDPVKPRNELGQAEFLELMTTQLTNQDPLKPMESGEFLGQIAQFSTVTGIKDLQDSFAKFSQSVSSDQALQAANLVGRTVLAASNYGLLEAGGNVEGSLDIPADASSVSLEILDSNGEQVKKIELGTQIPGSQAFKWDGATNDGTLVDPGSYEIKANAVIDGSNIALTPLVRSKVESVSLDRNGSGLTINVAGQKPISFSDIQQIL